MKSIKYQRLLFIVVVIVFNIVCVFFYSKNYDLLARYYNIPLDVENKIKNNLTKDEIEYIVSYQIIPEYFINYIECDNFSIYNVDYYHKIKENYWHLDYQSIVSLVTSTINYISIDTLINYLYYYDYQMIIEWFNSDLHITNNLLLNPTTINLYLDDYNTIYKYKNNNLYQYKDNIYLDNRLKIDLDNMCHAIDLEFNTNNCANIEIIEGYIDYDKSYKIYNNAKNNNIDLTKCHKAGHNELQTGLSFIISINGLKDQDIIDTKQYQWLLSNMHKYGFIIRYKDKISFLDNKDSQVDLLRYVSKDISNQIKYYNNSIRYYYD